MSAGRVREAVAEEAAERRRGRGLPKLPEPEGTLRRLLWDEHSCIRKYGDDGERSCGACYIDFLRDPVPKIKKRLEERNHKRLMAYLVEREREEARLGPGG